MQNGRYSQLNAAVISPFCLRNPFHGRLIFIYSSNNNQCQLIRKDWVRGALWYAPDNKVCVKASQNAFDTLDRRLGLIPFRMTCSQDSVGMAIPDGVREDEIALSCLESTISHVVIVLKFSKEEQNSNKKECLCRWISQGDSFTCQLPYYLCSCQRALNKAANFRSSRERMRYR